MQSLLILLSSFFQIIEYKITNKLIREYGTREQYHRYLDNGMEKCSIFNDVMIYCDESSSKKK